MTPQLSDIERDSPFDMAQRSSWSGEYIGLGGCATGHVTEADVDALLYYGDTGDGWDGKAAGVARLKDGRYLAWETWWGPTGSGFSEDAYGGEAPIYFGLDLKTLVLEALTDEGRRLAGIPVEGLA
jgi:hypothetical protein